MKEVSRRLLIKGKVQGVFFRASAKEMADKLGIKGWVRNTPAGDVEIVCQGPESILLTFINWCSTGPSRAKVEEVEVTDAEHDSFNSFEVIRGR